MTANTIPLPVFQCIKRTALICLLPVACCTSASSGIKENLASSSVGVKVQSVFNNHESTGRNSSFEMKRVRLLFDGRFGAMLRGHISLEGVDDSGLIVIQAFGDVGINPALTIRAGQFLVPFGRESRRSFDKRKFYSRSLVTEAVTRDMGRRSESGRNGRFRDIGAALFGGFKPSPRISLGYHIAVLNGNGILTEDNNDSKDLVARLTINGPPGVSVGGSAYTGTFLNESDSLSHGERALGMDGNWEGMIASRRVEIQAEYIAANYKTPSGDISLEGFYVQTAIMPLDRVELSVRYEKFRPDSNHQSGVTRRRVSLSARYYLYSHAYWAVDYEVREWDNPQPGNLLAVQLMVTW